MRTRPRSPVAGSAAVVAVATDPADLTREALSRLPGCVTDLEVRADTTGDPDPAAIRRWFSGRLVYTLRGGYTNRGIRLRDAARRGYDLVDLEADRDLVDATLAAIPAQRRRVSWCGAATSLPELRERFAAMARTPAALYLLAPRADAPATALAPLRLLTALQRTDVTAYASGPAGAWTRLLAPFLGAPVVSGHVSAPAAGGLPSVHALVRDYGFPALPPLRGLYGIVARSLHTPLFPRLANAALRELGLPDLLLPFPIPDVDTFLDGFWPELGAGGTDALGFPLRGLTVAAPYKDAALLAADLASLPASRVRAANLLLRRGDRWRAETTDGTAAVGALLTVAGGRRTLARTPVAVVGCGGTGRSVALALRAAGARVTLVNRGEGRGRYAARLLGLDHVALHRFAPQRYPVVVHATPVHEELPFNVEALPQHATVVDFVCAAEPTALANAARARGLTIVDGREILARELGAQFRLLTGHPLPPVGQLTGRAPVSPR
ncbi:MAG TPA: type I 3-dehydroquinate dehydratase [Rugosimonospora sp.]|nr:type I 3-dehydroquinate dehydratase [Rugosimonospora sp.]